jgi:hypothetical protein
VWGYFTEGPSYYPVLQLDNKMKLLPASPPTETSVIESDGARHKLAREVGGSVTHGCRGW